MRLNPLFALCTAALFAGACDPDGVINQTPIAVGGLRYINAIPDSRGVNFRVVDRADYAPISVNATFRTGGSPQGLPTGFLPPHLPVAAGTRHVKVFWNHTNPDSAQIVVAESNPTFNANSNYTYLLDGTFAAPTVTVINDDVAAPPAGQMGVRLIHVGGGLGAVDVYWRRTGTALPGTLLLTAVAENVVSAAAPIDTGTLAIAVYPTGTTTTPIVDVTAPAGQVGTNALNPIAGSRVAGSSLALVLFPPPVPASLAQTGPADTLPTAGFMTDRRPANTVP